MAFRQIKTPAIQNQAVTEVKLAASSVAGQQAASNVSALGNDTMLIHVAATDSLAKISVNNLVNSLDTSNLSEGEGNLYFTDQRAKDAVAADIASAVAAEATDRAAADAAQDATIAALQSEVDASQTGAGLGADGSYSANADANYISAATSLVDADNKLDAALKTEENARIAADANLQGQINNIVSNVDPAALDSLTEIVAAFQDADDALTASINTVGANLSNEITRAQGAEAVLQDNIDNVQAELDATQAGAGLSALGAYQAYGVYNSETNASGAHYIGEVASLHAADKALDAQVKANADAVAAEAARATGVETNLQTQISSNDTDIAANAAAISAEETRATGAEAALSQEIQDEITARGNADTAISNTVAALQGEVNTVELGAGLDTDGSYVGHTTSNYMNDATSLHNADEKLDAALKAADVAYKAADVALDARIDALEASSSSATGDVQGELNNTQTGAGLADNGSYTANATANYISEATSLKDADDKLDAQVKANADAIAAEEAARAAAVSGEATARETADANLQGQIDNIVSNTDPAALDSLTEVVAAFQAADSNINDLIASNTTAINQEASARQAADTGLQNNIDAEQARAEAAEAANATAISNEVTDRTNADDILQANIDSEAASRASADTAIQTELDATQVGAGLAADGGYNANALTDHIAAATSLVDADEKLDAAIVAETTRAEGVESNIQAELDATQAGAGLGTDGSYAADATTNYLTAASSLKDADKKLDAAMAALQVDVDNNEAAHVAGDAAIQAELDATQSAAGVNADGSYAQNATANYIATASSLNDADVKLDSALKAEETARIAADNTLQDNIDAEASARSAADTTLTNAIATEKQRAQAAESALDVRVTANESDIAALQAADTAESTARINKDSELQGEIDATQGGAGLETNGTYVANATANYIAAASSLKNADDLLDAAIKATDERVDHILNGSSESLDQFVEVVTAFQNADSDLNNAITTLASDASSARSDIQAELDASQAGAGLNADGTYSANTAANYIAAATSMKDADNKLDAAVKVNATAISTEKTRAETAEADLDSRIDVLEANSSATSGNIQGELNDTQTGAGLADNGSYTANATANYINTATSLKNADDLLDAALKAEETARTNAVNAEASARSTEDASIRSDFATADAAIQSELDATQAGAGLGTDGAYAADATTTHIKTASSLKNADKKLDAAIVAETTRASAAEATLTSDLADEVTRATDAEAALQGNIVSEAATRASANTTLNGRVDDVQSELDATQVGAGLGTDGGYTADAQANYTSTATSLFVADQKLDAAAKANADAIAAETTRATGAESTLQGNIDSEEAAREAADTALQGKIDTVEASAGLTVDGAYVAHAGSNYIATATSLHNADYILDDQLKKEAEQREVADTNLQNQIDFIKENVDPAALDSLTEVVAAFQAADSTLTGAVSANSADIAQEILDRAANDAALQKELNDTQIGAGLGANGGYAANITANYIAAATSLMDADNKLDVQIKANADAIADLQGNTATNLQGEIDRATAAEAALQAQITSNDGDIAAIEADIAALTTDEVAEGTNLYFTDARARAAVSVNDVEGNGDFSYDAATGVISADLSKSFLELTDFVGTETSYTGVTSKVPMVNAEGTGLIFVDPSEVLVSDVHRQTLEGDGATTTYALTFNIGSAEELMVFVGGVIQDPTTHYTANAATNTITFAAAMPVGTQAVVVGHSTGYTVQNGSITSEKLASDVKVFAQSADTTAGTSGNVVDTFDGTTYRSAKYVIQVDNGAGEFETREALVIHDGTNAYITEYAMVYTGAGLLGDASVQMNGNNVELVYTANAAGTTVKVISTYIDA